MLYVHTMCRRVKVFCSILKRDSYKGSKRILHITSTPDYTNQYVRQCAIYGLLSRTDSAMELLVKNIDLVGDPFTTETLRLLSLNDC